MKKPVREQKRAMKTEASKRNVSQLSPKKLASVVGGLIIHKVASASDGN